MDKANTIETKTAGQHSLQVPYHNRRLIYLLNISRIAGVALICLLLFMLTRSLLLFSSSAH